MMKYRNSYLVFLALFLPLWTIGQEHVIFSELNTEKMVSVMVNYEYILQFPEDYGNAELPLIVFLHGSGERGDNLDMVKVHGPWKFLEENPDYRFILLAPQCPAGDVWDPWKLDLLLDEIVKNHPVDVSRIYLTGLSMGGFGTLDLAMLRPDRFGAIAPVCGASNLHRLAAGKLKDLPSWFFHGALDDVVPYKLTARVVKELEDLGADVRFTAYPTAGHDSWTETYKNKELYDWFLIHEKQNTDH